MIIDTQSQPLKDRIEKALADFTSGRASMHVPPLDTDVDVVLAECSSALEAAEKRIADLETREVREEGNQFLVVRHPGKAPVIKHFTGELDAYLRQINEFDPLVTIDIIMHRYYGVGGQWVQDADEYLSAAGISVKGE